MSTHTKTTRRRRTKSGPVRRLLSALDRIIAAAKQAERARAELVAEARPKGGGE